ncbi:Serine/threonine-protein kinase 40 [Bulinus truncatus]|nr:Serine/threonine-protein kinase 40 [Bulinus truncatus]
MKRESEEDEDNENSKVPRFSSEINQESSSTKGNTSNSLHKTTAQVLSQQESHSKSNSECHQNSLSLEISNISKNHSISLHTTGAARTTAITDFPLTTPNRVSSLPDVNVAESNLTDVTSKYTVLLDRSSPQLNPFTRNVSIDRRIRSASISETHLSKCRTYPSLVTENDHRNILPSFKSQEALNVLPNHSLVGKNSERGFSQPNLGEYSGFKLCNTLPLPAQDKNNQSHTNKHYHGVLHTNSILHKPSFQASKTSVTVTSRNSHQTDDNISRLSGDIVTASSSSYYPACEAKPKSGKRPQQDLLPTLQSDKGLAVRSRPGLFNLPPRKKSNSESTLSSFEGSSARSRGRTADARHPLLVSSSSAASRASENRGATSVTSNSSSSSEISHTSKHLSASSSTMSRAPESRNATSFTNNSSRSTEVPFINQSLSASSPSMASRASESRNVTSDSSNGSCVPRIPLNDGMVPHLRPMNFSWSSSRNNPDMVVNLLMNSFLPGISNDEPANNLQDLSSNAHLTSWLRNAAQHTGHFERADQLSAGNLNSNAFDMEILHRGNRRNDSSLIKKAGPYILGPRIGSSPVRCIVQCLARKEKTNKFYIIKILTLPDLDKETMDDRQGKMLMLTEFSLLSHLENAEGVVHCIDFFKDKAWDSSEKSEINRLCLKLNEKEALIIFWDIACIVENLHKNNIVHRDLKLGNMIVDRRSWRVTITNFCLGRHLNCEKDTLRDQRGSPAYISPDVLSGNPYHGKPSDMWALGVVLFTMLYGQFPFYDSLPQELFRKIKSAEFTIPNDGRVTEDTKQLIHQLLTLDPQTRMTAGQVVDALNLIIGKWKAMMICDTDQAVPDFPTVAENDFWLEENEKMIQTEMSQNEHLNQ